MIDIHSHILPQIDDGSRNVSESISLLREERRQGVDTVFLTPHFYAEENGPVSFLKRRYRAWRKLEPYLFPGLPEVRLGAEVQYFEGICAVEEIQHLRIVGTDFLLLEMPFSGWSDRMVGDVMELGERYGLRVILAHIERYLPKQRPEIWNTLRAHGVLMQSNVSFFTERKTRKQALSMLEREEIHFLGSDCHNMESRRPNWDALPPQAAAYYAQSFGYWEMSQLATDGIHLDMT